MKTPRLLLRFLTVGVLALLLLVQLSMIRGAIAERQMYRVQAVTRVTQSAAGAQRLVGPLRVVSWTDSQSVEFIDDKGVKRTRVDKTTDQLVQTPLTLTIEGELVPGTRQIGLHEVRVYEWRAKLQAAFDDDAPQAPARVTREYAAPYLVLGLADVRGLVGTPSLRIDGRPVRLLPGAGSLAQRFAGVQAPLPVIAGTKISGTRIELDFALAGTESLSVAPIADSNRIAMSSPWPHPLFGGRFLPRTRTVGAAGFTARWDVSSLASDAQSQLRRGAGLAGESALDSLQVDLVDPVNVYSQADRASKYGILFIVLTFVGFALFELIKRLPIHPLQYLLVGLALAIFFLLLLSLSEHIPFWQAYVVSAAACIGLQGVYLSHVLQSRRRALGFAAMLTALYGVLYGLLVSEDNALLMGSLLLFGVLAAVMWITRKVDWYALGSTLR
ncbi:MAG: cell envelope integrity protein CreD [Luteimonas sp.]